MTDYGIYQFEIKSTYHHDYDLGRTMSKYIYGFGDGKADGDAAKKDLLGGKGANLAEMARLGLPVPAGFTISTQCCTDYFKAGKQLPQSLYAEIDSAMAKS